MKRRVGARTSRGRLVWAVVLAVLAVAGGFLAGERSSVRASTAAAPGLVPVGDAGPVDSAAMTAEERAGRLYDQVMRFHEAGRLDSARLYAPAALQAYAALGRLDAHTRYDVGMIWAAAGDSLKARSLAGEILQAEPTNLLGLLLAMRTAATPTLRAAYARRFAKAKTVELAKGLPDYDEHRHDIDGALAAAAGTKP